MFARSGTSGVAGPSNGVSEYPFLTAEERNLSLCNSRSASPCTRLYRLNGGRCSHEVYGAVLPGVENAAARAGWPPSSVDGKQLSSLDVGFQIDLRRTERSRLHPKPKGWDGRLSGPPLFRSGGQRQVEWLPGGGVPQVSAKLGNLQMVGECPRPAGVRPAVPRDFRLPSGHLSLWNGPISAFQPLMQ